ncbi:MAG: DUF2461 domain-containing protein [Bacteroidota bacterium]
MGKDLVSISLFLKKLAANNDRDWMTENKSEYQATRKAFETLIADLITGISAFDEGLVGLEAKKSVFRLHRDTRFSNDKSPYKLNYGASMSKGGRKSPYASYYIHLKPGENFVGGGMYMPDADTLKKVRQEIDYNVDEFLSIIHDGQFVKAYGEMRGEKLKTAPKGYPKDHEHINLLRHKGFYFMHEIPDAVLADQDFVAKQVEHFKLIAPFINFLNTAID